MLKKLLYGFLLLSLIIGLCAAALVYKSIDNIETARLSNTSNILLNVPVGSSLYSVKKQLEAYSDISSFDFKLWAKVNPEYTKIQAGTYEIDAGMSLRALLEKMSAGDVKQYSITLIEGLTWQQWYSAISKHPDLTQDLGGAEDVYAKLVSDDTSFCSNQYRKIEGCLLPDTYFFVYQDSAFSIIKRAYQAMRAELDQHWQDRFLDIPIVSPYEALILASIIEKETAIDSEREEIAGVFVNRLNQNMRLQTDPTVIYGIGNDFDGNITRKHLRTPTPYNTYTIKGLPITPIAMPSRRSLFAATRPALTDSLYFVATGDGGHDFSTNLADHNAAVQRYLANRKRKQNQ